MSDPHNKNGLAPPEVQVSDLADTNLLNSMDEETVSKHACPSLSVEPARLRAATMQKQDSTDGQTRKIRADGESDRTFSAKNLTTQSAGMPTAPRPRVPSLSHILVIALLFRLVLLVFSAWQDQTRWPDGQLRFTDVDYDVFTDAARAMVAGEDIYQARPTYRYSPLIAAVVAPGHWLFGSRSRPQPNGSALDRTTHRGETGILVDNQAVARLWGKLMFVLADLVCAWLQYRIIWIESDLHLHPGDDPNRVQDRSHWAIWFIVFGWLFNPVTAVVSVRGNAEALLGVCVLGCMLTLLQDRIVLAGLLFGLSVHLKLYPVIYAPAIYLWLSRRSLSQRKVPIPLGTRLRELLPSWDHVIFGLAALLSLSLLTWFGYTWFGGMRFLWQAYLYHFTRVDIKHNFAPHFYPLYLLTGTKWKVDMVTESGWSGTNLTNSLIERLRATTRFEGTAPSTSDSGLLSQAVLLLVNHVDALSRLFNLASFVPAAVLIPVLSFRLRQQPGLCWFVVTYTFVTFNKVCTSQYFLWSLVLLPVALPALELPAHVSMRFALLSSILLWLGAQALWLASAYTLEMRTAPSAIVAHSVWLLVWCASLVFLSVNVVLIRRFIKWRRPCSSSTAPEISTVSGKEKSL